MSTDSPTDLKVHLQSRLSTELENLALASPTPANRDQAQELFNRILVEDQLTLSRTDKLLIFDEIMDELWGFGPLAVLLRDDTVTEIYVNGPHKIYIVHKGHYERARTQFENEAHLLRILHRLTEQTHQPLDPNFPMFDAQLPDRILIRAILPPLAVNGPTIAIRRYQPRMLTYTDLFRLGELSEAMGMFLQAGVTAGLNLLVCGARDLDTTTVLNVLASWLPNDERIYTIERVPELILTQDQVSTFATNLNDSNIPLAQLIGRALRLWPERLVIANADSEAILAALDAINMGENGMLISTTTHHPMAALISLEQAALSRQPAQSVPKSRQYIASGIHLIVEVARLRTGSRKITRISEVRPADDGSIKLIDIFEFDVASQQHRATGIRPLCLAEIAARRIDLPTTLFDSTDNPDGTT